MNNQYDKIFLKKLQDCVIDLDELDEIIETNSERQSKVDSEISDWLHRLQNYFEELKPNRIALANIAERIATLRLERASLRNEFELIKRYKEISRQMMTKDNRKFVIAEIQKIMKNLNQPYKNRIISEEDIELVEAMTENEKHQIRKKQTRKISEESQKINDRIWDLYNQGISQQKIAQAVGLSQPSVNIRIKRIKSQKEKVEVNG